MSQAQEIRKSVFFRSFLSSLQSADYHFDNPSSVILRNDQQTKAIVQKAFLTFDEQSMLDDFSALLKIAPSNYGVVNYDEDGKLTFYTEPVIGLDSKGNPGLMIGADTTLGETKLASVFVPLTQNESGEYKLGESNSKVSLSLIGSSDQSLPKVPYLVLKSKKFVYHIGLRKPKDTPAELIDSAFDDSLEQFASHLSKFSAEFVAFGKMFSEAFQNKTFPEKGVLLVLEKGTYKSTKAKKQGQPDLISSMWKLAAYPEELAGFPVQNLAEETVELSEVGMIFCPASSDMTKRIVKNDCQRIETMFVLVRGVHKSNTVDWCPDHVAFEKFDRLSVSTHKAFGATIQGYLNAKAKTNEIAAATPAAEQTIDIESSFSSSVKNVANIISEVMTADEIPNAGSFDETF